MRAHRRRRSKSAGCADPASVDGSDRVRCYCSAEEYLSSNRLEEPACVLLDNQLPGLSGLELLKHIVAAASDSAVIMITAYGDVPSAVLAMKAGAFHFVQKPFDAEALLTTVEEALSRADEARDVPQETEEFKARLTLLTQREREVLALLLEGAPTKLIAHRLQISARTVEHHRAAIMQKTQARNISRLLRMTLSLMDVNDRGIDQLNIAGMRREEGGPLPKR